MAISEKVRLLGAGLYKNGIPDELTLTAIPTVSELDMVSAEDFDTTMLDKIFPSCIAEKVNFRELLEIDYYWLCRCLRILNYGPYHTTTRIFCKQCGGASGTGYQVNLETIPCKPLPEGFTNEIKIPRDSFIDFDGPVTLHLLTIQQQLNAYKDKAFQNSRGNTNREFARMCYMISEIGNRKNLTPVETKAFIEKYLSSADYMVLKSLVTDLADYGLRAGGTSVCPKCGNKEGQFIALVDDRFFRPSVDNLRKWRDSRGQRGDKDVSATAPADV